jgi:hypothetical protein
MHDEFQKLFQQSIPHVTKNTKVTIYRVNHNEYDIPSRWGKVGAVIGCDKLIESFVLKLL